MKLLKFSTGNGKLKNRLIFNIPAGYSCPHAGVCKTFADRTTGSIQIYLSSVVQKPMSIAALLLWQRPGPPYVKHVGTTGIY
jgi:hypothetical protein